MAAVSTQRPPPARPASATPIPGVFGRLGLNFGVLQFSKRAILLVWSTNRQLTVTLSLLTLAAGALPAVGAWVAKLVVDGVVAQMALVKAGAPPSYGPVLKLVLAEALVIALLGERNEA